MLTSMGALAPPPPPAQSAVMGLATRALGLGVALIVIGGVLVLRKQRQQPAAELDAQRGLVAADEGMDDDDDDTLLRAGDNGIAACKLQGLPMTGSAPGASMEWD
jgi:hypothetical protein